MDLERQQPADEREEKTAPETEIATPEMDLERQQPADEREEKTAPETEISSPEMDLERQQPADESITAVPSEMDLVTPDQLPDVANRLSRVKGKWYDIGMELGIQTSELDVIRDRRISRKRSMAKVIKIWHQGAKPTWSSLISALHGVKENQLAEEIERRFSEMDLVTPDQLPDVANRLSRVKGKWYDIGMELGIQTSELDVIRDRHISRRKSMAEVIKIWHQGAKPTWSSLISALHGVKEKQLAEEIERSFSEEATLADLLNELSEVVEWFQMGVHLEVSKGVLLKIEEDYRTVNRCMLHMLMTRMDQKELTWSDIVRALVKLKMRRLAQKIAVNHHVPISQLDQTVPLVEEVSEEQQKLAAKVEQLEKDLEDKDKELEKKQQLLEDAREEQTDKLQKYKTARTETKRLRKEKNELETDLKLKQQEVENSTAMHQKDERHKEAKIKRLQRKLQVLDGKLQSEIMTTQELRESLSQATNDLERKSDQVRELERARDEMRSDLEEERKRMNDLVMAFAGAPNRETSDVPSGDPVWRRVRMMEGQLKEMQGRMMMAEEEKKEMQRRMMEMEQGAARFKVGMKLEAKCICSDLTCVSTIKEIKCGQLLVQCDGYGDGYKRWHDYDSTDIHPRGWCSDHSRDLHPPSGMSSSSFNWYSYLQQQNAAAAPHTAFTQAQRN